ncbi:hypothetical protein V8D89_007755 [Ganoderma adspersum]
MPFFLFPPEALDGANTRVRRDRDAPPSAADDPVLSTYAARVIGDRGWLLSTVSGARSSHSSLTLSQNNDNLFAAHIPSILTSASDTNCPPLSTSKASLVVTPTFSGTTGFSFQSAIVLTIEYPNRGHGLNDLMSSAAGRLWRTSISNPIAANRVHRVPIGWLLRIEQRKLARRSALCAVTPLRQTARPSSDVSDVSCTYPERPRISWWHLRGIRRIRAPWMDNRWRVAPLPTSPPAIFLLAQNESVISLARSPYLPYTASSHVEATYGKSGSPYPSASAVPSDRSPGSNAPKQLAGDSASVAARVLVRVSASCDTAALIQLQEHARPHVQLDTLKGMASGPDGPSLELSRALPNEAGPPGRMLPRARARLMALRCISRGHGRGCRIQMRGMHGGGLLNESEYTNSQSQIDRSFIPIQARESSPNRPSSHLVDAVSVSVFVFGTAVPVDGRLQGAPSLDLHKYYLQTAPRFEHGSKHRRVNVLPVPLEM